MRTYVPGFRKVTPAWPFFWPRLGSWEGSIVSFVLRYVCIKIRAKCKCIYPPPPPFRTEPKPRKDHKSNYYLPHPSVLFFLWYDDPTQIFSLTKEGGTGRFPHTPLPALTRKHNSCWRAPSSLSLLAHFFRPPRKPDPFLACISTAGALDSSFPTPKHPYVQSVNPPMHLSCRVNALEEPWALVAHHRERRLCRGYVCGKSDQPTIPAHMYASVDQPDV